MNRKSVLKLIAAGLWIVVFELQATLVAAQDKAEGKLTVDGKTIEMHNAYLFTGPDIFGKHSEVSFVLLTDAPLSEEEIKQAREVRDLQKPDQGSLLYKFDLDMSYHLTIRHPVLGRNNLQTTDYQFQADKFGKERIAGTVYTYDHKVQEFPGGTKVLFEVRFDVAITRRFAVEQKLLMGPQAKKLPAGGGAPGKAYIEYCKPKPIPKTVEECEKQLKAEGSLPTDAELEEISKVKGHKVTMQEFLEEYFKMLKELFGLLEGASTLKPTKIKVLGGIADSRVAILQVEAMVMGARSKADVTMFFEAGKWTLDKEGIWTPVGGPKK